MKSEQEPVYQKGRRLRVFAGPNGSGKTTILQGIKEKYSIGVYVNADEIDQKLDIHNSIDLSEYDIKEFSLPNPHQLLRLHPLCQKAIDEGYSIDIEISSNKIINKNSSANSYEAALIADLIRQELLRKGKKFTFETVMSHVSKIELLQQSCKEGYRNYLYYVSTESPLINSERIKQRIQLGGHPVNEAKIENRYYRSMELLKEAIRNTYRSFIFDNSEKEAHLVLEIFKGEEVIFKYPEIPRWIDRYILN